jgi:hypothetical protein
VPGNTGQTGPQGPPGAGFTAFPNNTIAGNISGAPLLPYPLSGADVNTILPLFTLTARGLVPAPGALAFNVTLNETGWGKLPLASIENRPGPGIVGYASGSNQPIQLLTGGQAASVIGVFGQYSDGVVPATGFLSGPTGWFLTAAQTWAQPPARVRLVTQTFITATGVYTSPSDLLFAVVECMGGGGSGGSAEVGAVTQWGGGGGGGSGGYSRSILTAGQIGTSQNVTIGAGGLGANYGANGQPTSFGSLVVANGGGIGQTFNAFNVWGLPGAGAQRGTGGFTLPGACGGVAHSNGFNNVGAVIIFGGTGGQFWGGADYPGGFTSPSGGTGASAPANTGAGGNGGVVNGFLGPYPGGNGGSGWCCVTEFRS